MADISFTVENMDISKLKVPELKRELKLRGLITSGNKTDLMERLQGALKSKLDDNGSAESIDDLDDDLLNDDDLDQEHLETSESVLTELDEQFNTSPTKAVKHKLEDDDLNANAGKKIVLNRSYSQSENGDDISSIVETNVEDKNSNDKNIVRLSTLSPNERLEMRVKKFGTPTSEEAKKAARAQRFSITSTSSILLNTNSPNLDMLKKRAERFGGSVSKVMSSMEQQQRLEMRKERFGVVSTLNGTAPQTEKAKQRLERFKTPIK